MRLIHWFLLIWSIFVTFFILYLMYEPKLELILTEGDTHNYYTLYFMYLYGKEDEVDYKVIKLFTFKTKRK